MSKIRVEESDELVPVCPYCEKELTYMLARKLSSSIMSARYVYCCPTCRKVLGVSHRKGLLAS